MNPNRNARVAALDRANAERTGTDGGTAQPAISVSPVDASTNTNVKNSKHYNFASANPARNDDPTISSQTQVLMRFA